MVALGFALLALVLLIASLIWFWPRSPDSEPDDTVVRDGLRAKLLRSIEKEEWVTAWETVQDLLTEFPELKPEIEKQRQEIVSAVGRASANKLTAAIAVKEDDVSGINGRFGEAYASIAWVRGCDPVEGDKLEREVLKNWVAFGISRQPVKERKAIAEAILGRNANCTAAQDLLKESEEQIKNEN
jgi:hypothetical protein